MDSERNKNGPLVARAQSLPSAELIGRTLELVRRERTASAELIEHLVEIDRRRLYLGRACSSLYAYCMHRLHYSEDEAMRRVRVTRLAAQFPRVLEELRSGAIHRTGLYVLAGHVTEANMDALLTDARGKSRREIELVVARLCPRDAAGRGLGTAVSLGEATTTGQAPMRFNEAAAMPALVNGAEIRAGTGGPCRIEPLSRAEFRVTFVVGSELRDKIEVARELLSHSLPSGDLAVLFERALDELLKRTRARRMGSPRPNNPTAASVGKPGTGQTATTRAVDGVLQNKGSLSMNARQRSPNQVVPECDSRPRLPDRGAALPPDAALARLHADETKRTAGKRRRIEARSRYVPRAVARAVWERNGGQCTFQMTLVGDVPNGGC